MILKLGMQHQAMELFKVCINHDPGIYLRSQVSVYRTIGPLVMFLLIYIHVVRSA